MSRSATPPAEPPRDEHAREQAEPEAGRPQHQLLRLPQGHAAQAITVVAAVTLAWAAVDRLGWAGALAALAIGFAAGVLVDRMAA